MEPIEIWKLVSDTHQIVLKGVPNPDKFWIELYQGGEFVEKSVAVDGWGTKVKDLLADYDWKTYETSYVNPLFTKLVAEMNKTNGRYRRPSSRERILALYDRLVAGNEITLKRVADEFGVGPAEIIRDIRIIRNFLNEDKRMILYMRADKCYRLVIH